MKSKEKKEPMKTLELASHCTRRSRNCPDASIRRATPSGVRSTKPELLKRWFGPRGFRWLFTLRSDFRAGGGFRFLRVVRARTWGCMASIVK
jgi:hypothetical protein